MHYHAVHQEVADMFTPCEKKILNKILDQLIPANEQKKIPGAGQLDVGAFIIERMAKNLALKNKITKIVFIAQSEADKISPGFVRHLEKNNSDEFSSLLTETYMGYYSRADMREKLGLANHAVHPTGYPVDGEGQELLDTLTAPVRNRGKVFLDPTKGHKDGK